MADLYPLTPTTPSTMLLDGVGGCTTLVHADLHRAGAIFPAWPVDHQLETEGFAQIAKKLGGKLVGLPGYYVYHGACFAFSSLVRANGFVRRAVRMKRRNRSQLRTASLAAVLLSLASLSTFPSLRLDIS